jgi:hypothetical protein
MGCKKGDEANGSDHDTVREAAVREWQQAAAPASGWLRQ